MLTTDVPLPIQPVDLVEHTDQAIVDCDEVLTSDVLVEVLSEEGDDIYVQNLQIQLLVVSLLLGLRADL